MRLFLAIPVTGEAAASLRVLLERYRATGWPVKWVRDEGLHLTLKFLGAVEPERLPGLTAALAGALAGTPMLPFTATELGTFPPPPRARVVWAGFETEPALEMTVDRVERVAEPLGFPVEGRAFRTHATLGRVRQGARLPREAVESLAGDQPSGGFVADQVVLYESHLGAGGSVYSPVETFPLGI